MTTDELGETIASNDDDTRYFQTRAQWHENRAHLALDGSTRSLHLRFAKLYHERSVP